MKSLAESLGLVLPDTTPAPDTTKLSAKALAKNIIRSPEYLESIRRRILSDTLPPAVEVLLHHRADGKPIEQLEVKDVTDRLADLSVSELEAKLAALSALARRLRAGPEAGG